MSILTHKKGQKTNEEGQKTKKNLHLSPAQSAAVEVALQMAIVRQDLVKNIKMYFFGFLSASCDAKIQFYQLSHLIYLKVNLYRSSHQGFVALFLQAHAVTQSLQTPHIFAILGL